MNKGITQNLISAIIFDVDGVLVDTIPLHFRAWQKVFTEEGIVFGKKEYQKINGLPRDAGIRVVLQGNANPDRIQEIGDRKQNYYFNLLTQSPPRPLPGIISFLLQVQQMGWPMAAASSSKNASSVLASARIISYFDIVVTGHDFQYPKPHPDIFLTASQLMGVKPETTAVVEDAVNGVIAARAGGFYCVAVANSESVDDLRTAGASLVISSTTELTPDIFYRLDTV